MKEPLVSILLTSYNQGKYLREAIDSVLSQTFQDFELIISDDCSTDNSWEIIQSYDDPRIIKIKHEKNIGYQLTQDKLDIMRGKYLAIHHSDDVWVNNKLEKQVIFLENNKKYEACFTFVQYIDEDSNLWNENDDFKGCFQRSDIIEYFNKENRSRYEWLRELFYNGNHFCHPSVLIRIKTIPCHSFNHLIGYIQMPDYARWVEFCFSNDVYVYPEKLTYFRMRKKYIDNTSGKTVEGIIRSKYELKKVLDIYRKINEFSLLKKIFPEVTYVENANQVDTLYWLARLAYNVNDASYWLFAHDIMFDLLNDDFSRKYLLDRYSFGRMDLREITSKYDIFSVKKELNFIHAVLYYGNDNKDVQKNKIEKDILLNENGEFYVDFDLTQLKNVRTIIFNPVNKKIRMKLKKITINRIDVEFNIVKNNANKFCDDMDEFYHAEPQYWIDAYDGIINYLTIQGEIHCDDIKNN